MENSPLRKLAPELRNKIYELVFAASEIDVYACVKDLPMSQNETLTAQSRTPADVQAVRNGVEAVRTIARNHLFLRTSSVSLLRACKQIYNETKGYAVRDPSQYTFRLHVIDDSGSPHGLLLPPQLRETLRMAYASHFVWWDMVNTWMRQLVRNFGSAPGSIVFDLGIAPDSTYMGAPKHYTMDQLRYGISHIMQGLGPGNKTKVFSSLDVPWGMPSKARTNEQNHITYHLAFFGRDRHAALNALDEMLVEPKDETKAPYTQKGFGESLALTHIAHFRKVARWTLINLM